MKVICRGALYKKSKECYPIYCNHASPHEDYLYCDCTHRVKGKSSRLSDTGIEEIVNHRCMKNICISINSLEYIMKKVLEKDKK